MKIIAAVIIILILFVLHYFEQKTGLIALGYLKYSIVAALAIYSIIKGLRGLLKKTEDN